MLIETVFNWCFLTVFGLLGCAFTFVITSMLGQWLYNMFHESELWEWDDPETGPLMTAWIIACVFMGILFSILMYKCMVG